MYHQLTVVQLERTISNQNKSMLITRYIEDIYMCINNKYILISKFTGIGKQFISSQRTRGSYSELLKLFFFYRKKCAN